MDENIDVSSIYQFGDQFALDKKLNSEEILNELDQYKDQWSAYNPNKPHIKRYGLSLLNDTGQIGPGPDLDSLSEYNKIHNTNFKESHFNKPTKLYKNSNLLPSFFEDIFPYCIRSHFLKLPPGGFFPPHRDHTFGKQNFFRMIVPIQNYNPPNSYFMLENKPLYWNEGDLYIVNTTKQHALFNLSCGIDTIWLVINVIVCKASFEYVCSSLKER